MAIIPFDYIVGGIEDPSGELGAELHTEGHDAAPSSIER